MFQFLRRPVLQLYPDEVDAETLRRHFRWCERVVLAWAASGTWGIVGLINFCVARGETSRSLALIEVAVAFAVALLLTVPSTLALLAVRDIERAYARRGMSLQLCDELGYRLGIRAMQTVGWVIILFLIARFTLQ